jgi:hypothetical protein
MTQQDDDQAWNNTVNDPALESLETPTTQQEPLAEDNDSPATPADDNDSPVAPDHPAMDSNIDQQEAYDAGQTTTSGINAQDETGESKDQAITNSQQGV